MRGISGPFAIGLVASLWSPAPTHAGPPALLAQAHHVALGYELASGFVSESSVPAAEVLPEERQALERIRTEIEKWGRFVIVASPAQAELLIAIRRGRLVSYGVSTRPGDPTSGPPGGRPIGTASGESVQVSTPYDLIHVYDSRVGGITWRGTKPNGLSGQGPPLWRDFRAEVEKADRLVKKP